MTATRCSLFGEIAVAQGLCTTEQVEEALAQQAALKQRGIHKTLGSVLHDMEVLTLVQVNRIVDEVSAARRRSSIEGYEILSRLGKGGMGAVYRARQLSLNKIVAIKILPPKLAQNEDYLFRFQLEATATAKLNHTNIVGAYDVGESNGYNYFVMEYVEGETLKDVLERSGILDEGRALEIITQMADALHHAWAHGIVHRDIKPANIMISKQGVPKLCDLGLAVDCTDDHSITRSGVIMGTPYYLSPEQARSEKLDCRSDIYSLGATLFHMVTGAPPFDGDTPAVILTKHLNEPAPDPQKLNPVLSSGLCYLIGRMLAKGPEDRYQTPQELLTDLRELTDTRRLSGRHARRRSTAGPGGPEHAAGAWRWRRPALALLLLALLPFGVHAAAPDAWPAAAEAAARLLREREHLLSRLPTRDHDDRSAAEERLAARALQEIDAHFAEAPEDRVAERDALLDLVARHPDTRAAESARPRVQAIQSELDQQGRAAFFQRATAARAHREAGRFSEARAALRSFPEHLRSTMWHHQAEKEVDVVDAAARERFEELAQRADALAAAGRYDEAARALRPAQGYGLEDVAAEALERLEALERARLEAGDQAARAEAAARDAHLRRAMAELAAAVRAGDYPGAAERAAALAEEGSSGPAGEALQALADDLAAVGAAFKETADRLGAARGQEVTLRLGGVDRAGRLDAVRGGRVFLDTGVATVGFPLASLDLTSWLGAAEVGGEARSARLRGVVLMLLGRDADARELLAAAGALGEDVAPYLGRLR